MGGRRPRSLTLDTAALIAVEGGDRRVYLLLRRAIEREASIHIPAGVLAQAWRGGGRQARLAALLDDPSVAVEDLDSVQAKAIGELCGRRNSSDIVDASVVLTGRRHASVVVSGDREDLLRLDPKLEVESI